MNADNVPADPRNPALTSAQDLADWLVTASPEQVQALADWHGEETRRRRATGDWEPATMPETWQPASSEDMQALVDEAPERRRGRR